MSLERLEGRGSEPGVVMGREFREEGKADAKAWGWELTCCWRNMKDAKEGSWSGRWRSQGDNGVLEYTGGFELRKDMLYLSFNKIPLAPC